MSEVLQLLSDVPPLRDLSTAELENLIRSSDVRIASPEGVVVRKGRSWPRIGIVLAGELEVVATDDGDSRSRVSLLEPGDMFGQPPSGKQSASEVEVLAVTESVYLMIPWYTWEEMIGSRDGSSEALASVCVTLDAPDRTRGRAQARAAAGADRYGLGLSSSRPAKILVINCGSSSLKYNFYDTHDRSNDREGIVERIGIEGGRLVHRPGDGTKVIRELGRINHDVAFEAVVEVLTDSEMGVIRDLSDITGVGHRVVHGGSKYSDPVVIDDDVVSEIERLCSLAPLHNPHNLAAIRKSMALMPQVPQVAVFDTGFHQRMPAHAYMYALPYSFYEQQGIRRYGFHGISHNYLALRAASCLERDVADLRIITCHLGNGSSVSAVDRGRSVDTSMGLTPLEGLVMGTRSGDIDPGAMLHMARTNDMGFEELDSLLNRKSGVLGLSGISNDFREIEDGARQGNRLALLALHVFCHRLRKYIGAYIAVMGGLDVMVFSAGIGERSPWVRSLTCQGLSELGIELEDRVNRYGYAGGDEVIDLSSKKSRVKVLAMQTDEGRMIARETIRALDR
ncbi:acetate/propionate family kinase [Candidatus Fermentibacterales bacterium]|nr:acetate/propionate family kinase [Candidatus Fermentibacterales bacterium]